MHEKFLHSLQRDDSSAYPARPVVVNGDDCSHDTCKTVTLLSHDTCEDIELRSTLQALGIKVFLGPDSAEDEAPTPIVLHMGGLEEPDIARRLAYACMKMPMSPVCIVTGRVPDVTLAPGVLDYCDTAEALMRRAGIPFVSIAG